MKRDDRASPLVQNLRYPGSRKWFDDEMRDQMRDRNGLLARLPIIVREDVPVLVESPFHAIAYDAHDLQQALRRQT
jgi:hypothetical protein